LADIAVIGSVARDEVFRLASPLRAGAHLNARRTGFRLGGGGANTALALAAAGHRVRLLAAVGRDADGDALIAELDAAGIDTSGVARLPDPTTHSLILVDAAGERTVVNVSRCEAAEPPQGLMDHPCDAVYVRSRRRDLAPLLSRMAQRCLVVAHLPPTEPGCRPAQVLVCSASDLSPAEAADPLALGRAAAGGLLQWIAVTAGAAGAEAVSATGRCNVPAAQVRTVDTTGAGDAFAAGLLHGLVSGGAMPEALALGVRFGTEATLWDCSALPATAVQRLLATEDLCAAVEPPQADRL
jgi:sugar/nucleoside kinase (ribokinase family)